MRVIKAVKKVYSTILALAMLVSSLAASGQLPRFNEVPETKPGEYGQWVNPFIGTGGIPWSSAMLFPGATAPYSTVRLSPDTTFVGGVNAIKMANAGYCYEQNYIWGFSHTRLSGTGARDMGHFRVTPAVGKTDPAKRLKNPLMFSHEQESATAGYYTVNLPGIDCVAELTATAHTGAHKYTFNSEKDAHIFIDATSFLAGGRAEEGKIIINAGAMEVTGEGRVFTDFTGRYDGLKGYFVAKFNKPFVSFSSWDENGSVEGRANAEGNDTGANINFGNMAGEAVEIKIGISFVSLENARLNLEAETENLDFEGVRAATRNEWDNWLSKIKIETDDPEIKTIFYTALYHSMIMPGNFTDANGEYLGFNETTGKAEGYTYRTDMSLWDTFRTVHPLMTIIAPEIQLDCVKSLLAMADEGGTLPRWPSGGGYTGSMLGTPADMVIAESYLKGITGFDAEKAYSYMKKTSDEQITTGADGRKYADYYNTYGYCPADFATQSVSHTLEYAWADSSISLLASALGYEEEAARYKEKSMNYKNIFNPETKYFQGKNSDGSWLKPLMPNMTSYYDEILIKKVSNAYAEGSARQWRWSVPHDTKGMIDLFGTDYFISELEDFMADASKNMAGLNPGAGYWQGNQHDIHAPYLFTDAGRADLTQKWVRWILTERHSTDTKGLDGNDDGGTLSAWYVFSAMGFYPVAGTDRYWVGAPIVDGAEINLGNGKTLKITAENQSAENLYVQQVTLNGKKLTQASITHAEIAQGGTLAFEMGSTPAENGGF